jgi:hypothetical protein
MANDARLRPARLVMAVTVPELTNAMMHAHPARCEDYYV